jgi:hypothetical protein
VSIPHPEKVFKGGEDASFVSNDGQAMGVFDGVGSWSDVGVDPGVYSKALAENSKSAYQTLGPDSPTKILEHAWLKASSIVGSSMIFLFFFFFFSFFLQVLLVV